jgi:hypothetical protein
MRKAKNPFAHIACLLRPTAGRYMRTARAVHTGLCCLQVIVFKASDSRKINTDGGENYAMLNSHKARFSKVTAAARRHRRRAENACCAYVCGA